jgi:hypothetical protein
VKNRFQVGFASQALRWKPVLVELDNLEALIKILRQAQNEQ